MYDYLLIGAGSAGCVLAHRLTEDASVRVLLLEAGGPDTHPAVHIPAAFSKRFRTEDDWDFFTVPQRHADNRAFFWPRGKVLGGSSSINAMIYIRGHRSDYDRWAADGNPGWSYAEVLPYFKKSEDHARGASAYHGSGGPLHVSQLPEPHPLSEAFITAAVQAGLPHNDDFNGAQQEGAGLFDVNIKGGRRWSAVNAFLKPAMERPNLHVETHALVTRLLVEGTRVVGVEYLQHGVLKTVRAQREVVLAGGAINSPHLLMVSGIGPADHLRSRGVAVKHDLPGVGQNLQDHPVVGVRFACTQPITMMNAESPVNVARYLFNRTGMLASNVAEACAFIRTRDGEDGPDVQYHFGPVDFNAHGQIPPRAHLFSVGPVAVRPRSRGQITLRSGDPLEYPLIDPNYFADDADMQSLLGGIRMARTIVRQSAFAPFRGKEFEPGVDVDDEAALRAYIRATAETLYHPVGTCRMGQDALAVVDDQLRVHGLHGLRVVDASVMPHIPAGNTNAPTYMIAEKAADLLRFGTPAAAKRRHAEAVPA